MSHCAIYIDGENIRMNGGYGMRYDTLVQFATRDGYQFGRGTTYVVEDPDRPEDEQRKSRDYHNKLRGLGFKVVRKAARRYHVSNGGTILKANVDVDMTVDVLVQCYQYDKVVLVTGDGDFVPLVEALQNRGIRVEVISFRNVSRDLKFAADSFINGYTVAGLIKMPESVSPPDRTDIVCGTIDWFDIEAFYGFLRHWIVVDGHFEENRVFFHGSDFKNRNITDVEYGSALAFSTEPGSEGKLHAIDIVEIRS